jgi:DNA polymerase delta subunit 1
MDAMSALPRLSAPGTRIWFECFEHGLRCVQDVLCTSKDCPIFYMRKKAQKDVEDSELVLDRFSDEMW